MRVSLTPAAPQETLRDALVGVGPAGGDTYLKESPGFRLQLAGREAHLEPVAGQLGSFRVAGTGLAARLNIELCSELGVAAQQLVVTNEGAEPSPHIRQIDAFSLPLEVYLKDAPRATGFGGGLTHGFYPPKAYRPEQVCFGEARTWIPQSNAFHRWWTGRAEYRLDSDDNGRSSRPHLPIMFTSWQTPGGRMSMWAGLEWSARWWMEFSTGGEWRFTLRGGPRVKDLVLAPGESIRLPRVHVGICAGAEDACTNHIRRYVAESLSPDVEGRRPLPYAAYNTWAGLHESISEDILRKQADVAAELGLEYFMIDSGWFTCEQGKFWTGVGNWHQADRTKFPNGLEPIAEYVHSKGMRLGLWFEPERAYRQTSMYQAHPDWFWDIGLPSPQINLTRRDVQDGLADVLSSWIERLDIRWLRIDANQAPGPYWDAVDPTGKVQFGYVEGLYRVLDLLLARHENLVIDNCAGGGNRIDFGMLRRTSTMAMSDQTEDRHVVRLMQTGGARILPGNFMRGVVYNSELDFAHAADPQALISRMAGGITIPGHIAKWSAAQRRATRRHIDGYKTYRHLLMKDFYALTPYPSDEAAWDVVEFVDPSVHEAVVLAYRVRGETSSMRVLPRHLDPERTYDVLNPFSGKKGRQRTGRDLMSAGLRLSLKPECGLVRHMRPVADT